MSAQFSLRPATSDDMQSIIQIEQKVHVSSWTESQFQSELAKPYSNFLVLTDDETDTSIAGYIIFWMMYDECQILNLAVDLAYRGLGLAKMMMRKAMVLAIKKGIRKMTLEVRKSNLAAIQLYQELHFAIIHVRKNFYSNGEDAYSMMLSLEDDLRF